MNVNEVRKNCPLSRMIVKDMRKTAPVDKAKRNWRKGLKLSAFEGFNRMNGVKRYICIGGRVQCLDGDLHFISCSKMPALYNVRPSECVFIPDQHADTIEEMPDGRLTGSPKLLGMDSRQYVVLLPDSTGRYALPDPIEAK